MANEILFPFRVYLIYNRINMSTHSLPLCHMDANKLCNQSGKPEHTSQTLGFAKPLHSYSSVRFAHFESGDVTLRLKMSIVANLGRFRQSVRQPLTRFLLNFWFFSVFALIFLSGITCYHFNANENAGGVRYMELSL